MAGIGTGVVLGAFFGVEVMLRSVIAAVKKCEIMEDMKTYIVPVASAVGAEEVAVAAGVVVAAVAVTGGIIGGVTGHEAAKGAETVQEAASKTYKAVMEKRNATLSHITNLL